MVGRFIAATGSQYTLNIYWVLYRWDYLERKPTLEVTAPPAATHWSRCWLVADQLPRLPPVVCSCNLMYSCPVLLTKSSARPVQGYWPLKHVVGRAAGLQVTAPLCVMPALLPCG